MKPDIHPDYVLATVRCSCGNEFQTRPRSPSSTWRSARSATRSTRASRSSWTRAAAWNASNAASSAPASLKGNVSALIGGQAVLEGVMSAARRRGRSPCARPTARSPRSTGRSPGPPQASGFGSRSSAASSPSASRSRSVSARCDLGELRRAGRRGGRRGRTRSRPSSRTTPLRVRDRDRLRPPALQGLAGAHHQLAADRIDRRLRGRRGHRPRRHLHLVPRADRLPPDLKRVFQYHAAEHKAINAYEAGDPLEPEIVSAPQPSTRPLRHRVPALRHGHRHLCLPSSSAGMAPADPVEDLAPATHSGHRVRNHPLRRQHPSIRSCPLLMPGLGFSA